MDAQELLIAYLSAALALPCSAQVPRKRPSRFVTVERTGGPCDEFVDSAQLAVQCWGESYADAKKLAINTRNALRIFTELDAVADCECESLYWFPGEGNEPRWQLTVTAEVYI